MVGDKMIKTERMAAADLIMGILLVIFGGIVIWSSLNMKIYKTFLDAPGFFPFILGIIFIGLGILMTFSALQRKGYEKLTHGIKKFNISNLLQSVQFKRVIILIVLMVFYIFVLVDRIHFTIATTIYLFLTLYYLISTSLIKIIIISVATAFLISTFFTEFFEIPLP
jgi:hypothetical protein